MNEEFTGYVLLFYHENGGRTFLHKLVTIYINKLPNIRKKNYPNGFSYTKVSSYNAESMIP
jgi:hypothetical protein